MGKKETLENVKLIEHKDFFNMFQLAFKKTIELGIPIKNDEEYKKLSDKVKEDVESNYTTLGTMFFMNFRDIFFEMLNANCKKINKIEVKENK